MQFPNVDPTLAVAAIAGIVTLLISWKRPFVALSALILLIPFRDFMTRWLNSHTDLSIQYVTGIGRWWSGVIVVLLLITGWRWITRQLKAEKFPQPGAVDIMLGILVVLALVAAMFSPNRQAGLISLRIYLQTLPVFLLARLIIPSKNEVRVLLPMWLAVGVVMGAFSIFQTLAWDETTYRSEAYVRSDGQLVGPLVEIGGEDYLRPTSTVSGPNELGVDMVVVITITLFWLLASNLFRSGLLIGAAVLFATGLAVSLSRSGVLGLGAAITVTFALRWSDLRNWLQERVSSERKGLIALGAIALAIMLLVLASTGLPRLLKDTIRTLPNQYHSIDSAEAIQFLARQPQGAGMGMIRPNAALDSLEIENAYHVEGSLFQIAVEMGIWGLLAWGVFVGLALIRIIRNRGALDSKPLRILSGSAVSSWAAALVAFAILPLMQSASLMIWLWFLLGIGLNTSEIQLSWNQAKRG